MKKIHPQKNTHAAFLVCSPCYLALDTYFTHWLKGALSVAQFFSWCTHVKHHQTKSFYRTNPDIRAFSIFKTFSTKNTYFWGSGENAFKLSSVFRLHWCNFNVCTFALFIMEAIFYAFVLSKFPRVYWTYFAKGRAASVPSTVSTVCLFCSFKDLILKSGAQECKWNESSNYLWIQPMHHHSSWAHSVC